MDSSHRVRVSPPAMAPYERAIKSCTMAQPSTYPSPARSDSDTSKYHPDGLGLYNYSMPLTSAGTPSIYPPTPEPTESWTHLTNGTPPLMTEAPVESWPSLYDPPLSKSPMPWNAGLPFPQPRYLEAGQSPDPGHNAVSHRTSLSSSQDMTVYSGEDPDHSYPQVKVEGPEWAAEDAGSRPGLREPPLTVSPDRLSTAAFPYTCAYGSPSLPGYEAQAPGHMGMETRYHENIMHLAHRRERRITRRDVVGGAATHRVRVRRNPTTPENANYKCDVCGKLFQRSYNHKTHMEIHDPDRQFPNPCTYPNCTKRFVRRTDLLRHEKSVHVKAKDFKCSACDSRFARKDTLRRHEEDGCSKRNELRGGQLPPPAGHSSPGFGYHNAHLAAPPYSRSPSLQTPVGFRGSPSGY